LAVFHGIGQGTVGSFSMALVRVLSEVFFILDSTSFAIASLARLGSRVLVFFSWG